MLSVFVFASGLLFAHLDPTDETAEVIEAPLAQENPVQENSSVVEEGVESSSEDSFEECSDKSPYSMRLGVRHVEPKGIGYKQGYTTVEGFFTPSFDFCDWTPFLDLRLHIFDNGKPAINAGVGARYWWKSFFWGMNTYYDYRKTTHSQYNQISWGLEALNETWDFRINGYLPVGNKLSPLYNKQFEYFSGNYMYIGAKQEYPFAGWDAECGFHLNSLSKPLYFTGGIYYLNGQGQSAWGGKGRASVDIIDYVRIEGSFSYDHIFKWIGQAQLAVMIPFGKKKEKKCTKSSCFEEAIVERRAIQPVYRHEIIPVNSRTNRSIAINPATNSPYIFWFVDNTSHSNGTFESPFNTLVAAVNASSAGDIIYVFPGDKTANGLNTPITLKDSQRLLGSGVSHGFQTQLGYIPVGVQVEGLPVLTPNVAGSATVTASNNNEISGLQINSSSIAGITVNGINVLIDSNLIIGNGVTGINLAAGARNSTITLNTILTRGSGANTITVRNGGAIIDRNTMTAASGGNGVSIINAISASVTITNNHILGADTTNTWGVYSSGGMGNLFLAYNTFGGISDTSGLGLGVRLDASSGVLGPNNISIVGNKCDQIRNSGVVSNGAAIFALCPSNYPSSVQILDNDVYMGPSTTNYEAGIIVRISIVAPNNQVLTATVQNNSSVTSSGIPGYKYVNSTGDPSLLVINSSNNVGTTSGPP